MTARTTTASKFDSPQSKTRRGSLNSGSAVGELPSSGRKQSVDPRHTRPKSGGWPSIPPSKSFTLWVPNEHEEKLRRLAASKGCSVAALIRHAVSEMLEDGSRHSEVPRGAKARTVRPLREEAAPAIRKK